MKIILGLSVADSLFSGYFSYNELFLGSYAVNFPIKCGSCEFVTLPACAYGFVMYVAVFVFLVCGLRKKKMII